MRKLIIVVASLLVVVLFILQGFQQTHPLPEPDNNRQSTATGEGDRGCPGCHLLRCFHHGGTGRHRRAAGLGFWGGYFLPFRRLRPLHRWPVRHCRCHPGGAKAGAGSLRPEICWSPYAPAGPVFLPIMISTAASELAENGVIYTLGDYYVLLMINDTDHVRELLEQYIPT